MFKTEALAAVAVAWGFGARSAHGPYRKNQLYEDDCHDRDSGEDHEMMVLVWIPVNTDGHGKG